MAQKVITVSAGASVPNGAEVLEKEYPKLQKALDEGYRIIEAKPLPFGGAVSATYYAIMFVLEKD